MNDVEKIGSCSSTSFLSHHGFSSEVYRTRRKEEGHEEEVPLRPDSNNPQLFIFPSIHWLFAKLLQSTRAVTDNGYKGNDERGLEVWKLRLEKEARTWFREEPERHQEKQEKKANHEKELTRAVQSECISSFFFSRRVHLKLMHESKVCISFVFNSSFVLNRPSVTVFDLLFFKDLIQSVFRGEAKPDREQREG